MTNPEDQVLDDIDRLVDEQLAQESSGYDHNVNQPRCWHCGRDWHGMPLTRRIEHLRTLAEIGISVDRELAEYRADEDDSELLCPGSMFIGPRRPTTWERATRNARAFIRAFQTAPVGGEAVVSIVDADGNRAPLRNATIDFAIGPDTEAAAQYREQAADLQNPWRMPIFRRGVVQQMESFADDFIEETVEDLPATPQQRALPRPSTTPPMWTARADGRRHP